MATNFSGTWVAYKGENNEEYMKKIELPAEQIQGYLQAKTVKTIEQDGDAFKIKTDISGMVYDINFTVGEEFEVPSSKGSVRSVASWQGDKLVFTVSPGQLLSGKGDTTYELSGSELVITRCYEEVVSKAFFKKE